MNFDLAIDRTCTNCQKWDNVPTVFGVPDALPMWVADMDFAAPPAVVEALHKRVEHGVFGYTFPSDSYREAIGEWMKNATAGAFSRSGFNSVRASSRPSALSWMRSPSRAIKSSSRRRSIRRSTASFRTMGVSWCIIRFF